MTRSLATFAIAGILFLSSGQAGLARGNDLTIKDGFGEEITIKNGWFGRKERMVKDRFGDQYVSKQGVFGGKETEVNLLGNRIKKKKGWFGGSDIEGSSILGDKITTKKGWFGRRKTEVDVSGISSLIRDFVVEGGPKSLSKKFEDPATLAAPVTLAPPVSADPLDQDVLTEPPKTGN